MTLLQEAIKTRDKYLTEHPNMIEYQQEIDETLNKCREEDRFTVVSLMISSKMFELHNKLAELQVLVNKEK